MIELTVVDAFTAVPFRGNPAAVCVLEEPAEEAWMARVALEMNLSETAYLRRLGEDLWSIRWFTPKVEVDLCGHATIASAHALWAGGETANPLQFDSRSGRLQARRLEDGWIQLDFPATPAQEEAPPAGLAEALGVQPLWVGRSRFDLLVEVETAQEVRALDPDHSALARLPVRQRGEDPPHAPPSSRGPKHVRQRGEDPPHAPPSSRGPKHVRGVMVTARGDGEFDFVSRFFAPGSGVPEDPVTGSAHCCLTPHWAARLGKARMRAYQASLRGGTLRVELRGERVLLEGQAVSVAQTRLLC